MKLFVAAMAVLLAGCANGGMAEGGVPDGGSANDSAQAAPMSHGHPGPVDGNILARPDAAGCKAAGGFLARRGRMQSEMCVHPYSDAGMTCTDNQQCEGKCVTQPDAGPDGSIAGQCQADDALFGCYAEVVDSKAVRAICVD